MHNLFNSLLNKLSILLDNNPTLFFCSSYKTIGNREYA